MHTYKQNKDKERIQGFSSTFTNRQMDIIILVKRHFELFIYKIAIIKRPQKI